MKKNIQFRSFIPYVLVMFFCYLLYLFYDQTIFLILVLLEVMLLFFSYHITKKTYSELECALYFNPGILQRGYFASLNIIFQKKNLLPLSSVEIPVKIRSSFYKQTENRIYFFPLRAGRENTISFPIEAKTCGMLEASLDKVVIWDFFHIFHFTKEKSLNSILLVYPHAKPVAIPTTSLYAEGFDEYEEVSKTGNVSANVTDIREYQPGDRLQKIHWKLSSKLDKLFVKENEATSSNQLFLLPELYIPEIESSFENTALDRTLSLTYGICLTLIAENYPFTLVVYSVKTEDFLTFYILCKEDLEKAYREIFYQSCYPREGLALDIYQKSGMQNGTLLHITHKGVTDVSAD